MFVGVLMIAIIGFILDLILKIIESRICYWHTGEIK